MSSSTFNFKHSQAGRWIEKIPAPLILLVLVLVFECIYYLATEPLTGQPWMQPTPDDGMVAAKYAMAQTDRRYDIAFVGDSSCLRGVVADQFSAGTGLAAINLCTHKMHSTAGYALMAARVAQQHPELKAIVLVVTPETLGLDEAQIIEFGALGKHLAAYGDEGLGLSPGLRGYQQWFVSRHAFRSFPDKFGGSYGRLAELLEETSGYLPEEPSDKVVKFTYPREFKLAPWQKRWVVRLNSELEKLGIPLFLALSPIPVDGSNPAFVQSAEQAMTDLAQPLGKVRAIRPVPPEYPNSAFATLGHLQPEWAANNTRDLMARITAALDQQ